MIEINKTYQGDSLAVLKTFPDNFIDCVCTSPPYWGLRDYGVDGQLGLESTPEEYVSKMVTVFNEVKRVLKPTGTLWLNLGDSYAGSGKGGSEYVEKKTHWKQGTNTGSHTKVNSGFRSCDYKPKDLIGIPWAVAFALRNSGWWLRSEIIWAKAISGEINKGTCMPESVSDRPTKAHEQIFLLSKSAKYYYDSKAIQEKSLQSDKVIRDRVNDKINNGTGLRPHGNLLTNDYEFKNKRDVWHYGPPSFSEAHFATFPPELIVDCIKAGCPEDGIVLDPFNGSGTTRLVAEKLGRNSIGIELNPKYIQIENRRRKKELGMFEKIAS